MNIIEIIMNMNMNIGSILLEYFFELLFIYITRHTTADQWSVRGI